MLLVKLPVPAPSAVLSLPIVGVEVFAQQIPRAVNGTPPSSEIFPPDDAVVEVTDEIAVVVIVATTIGLVVNETSLPYAVPMLFVA